MFYTLRVVTKKNGRHTRAAARATYRAARDAWVRGDRAGPCPSNTLDECAWVAAVQVGGQTWLDGGSTERTAIARAVAHAITEGKEAKA